MLILNIQVSSRPDLPIKSYEPEKICLILENRGKHPVKSYNLNENHTIRFSVSENLFVEVSSSYLQKCAISHFCQKTDHGCVFICFFLFFSFLFFRSNGDEKMVIVKPEKKLSRILSNSFTCVVFSFFSFFLLKNCL